jgi:hypothetical protein
MGNLSPLMFNLATDALDHMYIMEKPKLNSSVKQVLPHLSTRGFTHLLQCEVDDILSEMDC